MSKERIAKIEQYLDTDFELKLFKASIAYLENNSDPLRFNSFSYSLRELIRNILSSRAPDKQVTTCTWYRPETDNGKPSRKQRYLFSVQGGLSKTYVSGELDVSPLESWQDIKTAIDSLSKYTHVSPETFDIDEATVTELSNNALDSLLDILEMIDEARNALRFELENHIDSGLIDTFVMNSMSDIDILSNQSYVESCEVNQFHITDIDNVNVYFEGSGIANTSLNYGKRDDACELNPSFPFTYTGYCKVDKPNELIIPAEQISIDISSWYE